MASLLCYFSCPSRVPLTSITGIAYCHATSVTPTPFLCPYPDPQRQFSLLLAQVANSCAVKWEDYNPEDIYRYHIMLLN